MKFFSYFSIEKVIFELLFFVGAFPIIYLILGGGMLPVDSIKMAVPETTANLTVIPEKGMIFITVIVMCIAGLVGGLVNYFISDPKGERELTWWQHIIVGEAAAFMVPLFLNMISANLIDVIIYPSLKDDKSYSKLFVLAGFCLVAAVSSRSFIKTISEKLLQEVRSANKKAEEAKEKATLATEIVAPLVEEEVSDTDQVTKSLLSDYGPFLSEQEQTILKLMGKTNYALRSLSGIARDAGLPLPETKKALSILVSKGLAVQGQNTNGQPRWYQTAEGRRLNIPDTPSTSNKEEG